LDPTELEPVQGRSGSQRLSYGLRQSPIFVGSSYRFWPELVPYIGTALSGSFFHPGRPTSAPQSTPGLIVVGPAALVSFGFGICSNDRWQWPHKSIPDQRHPHATMALLPPPYIILPISAVLPRAATFGALT